MSRSLKILVLGGKGFIGSHAVKYLRREDVDVTIGTRHPSINSNPAEVGVVLHRMLDDSDWVDLVSQFDVVLNSVGILRQRSRETYDSVHHLAPAAIAAACSRAGTRFVHVSAVGRIAALTADDAGEALANLCVRPDSINTKNVDLGGEEYHLFEDYIRGLRRRHTSHRALAIRLPGILTRVAAHFFDLIHFSPFSFGHWEMLCHDNIPRSPHLREVLSRPPTKVIEN